MNKRIGDWIQTATGRQFWPCDPRSEEVDIDDIAFALSKLCRFGGHCVRFYSVAEHSVLLARVLDGGGRTRETCRAALLHDASEGYLVDVPKPIKPFLHGYYEFESRIMQAVCAKFSVPYPLPSVVHDLDVRMLMTERLQNMSRPPAPWNDENTPPLEGVKLQYWEPERARMEFLRAFYRYMKP